MTFEAMEKCRRSLALRGRRLAKMLLSKGQHMLRVHTQQVQVLVLCHCENGIRGARPLSGCVIWAVG